MKNCSIKVDFLAGTDFDRAFDDAIEMAKQLDIVVEYNLNGVNVFVTPTSKIERVKELYDKDIVRKNISYGFK